jgi:hypothetical protein
VKAAGSCTRHEVDAAEARKVYSALVAAGFTREDLSGLATQLERNTPAVTAAARSLLLAVSEARVEAAVARRTLALPGLDVVAPEASGHQLPLLAAQEV